VHYNIYQAASIDAPIPETKSCSAHLVGICAVLWQNHVSD